MDILRWRAEHQPSRRAFLFLDERQSHEQELTYAELHGLACAIAELLESVAKPGDRALLCYPPGLGFIAAFMGCLYAGVAAVPVYPPRSARQMEPWEALASDCQPRVALTTQKLKPLFVGHLSTIKAFGDVEVFATDLMAPDPEKTAFSFRPSAWTPAFLQYTSGSTGNPKGVIISHGNLMANEAVIAHAFGTGPEDIGLNWLPLHHDMGLIGTVLHSMYRGLLSILMPAMDFIRDPLSWLQAVTRHRATICGGPNFAYELCARRVKPEHLETLNLSAWRLAFCGAEPIRPETLRRFANAFASVGFQPGAFYPCYGMAESTLLITGRQKPELPLTRVFESVAGTSTSVYEEVDGGPLEWTSCGSAFPDHSMLIVDPRTREPVPPGHTGEIWLTGPSVAMGYWNKPRETKRTFGATLAGKTHPRYLRTGDLGFMRRGELFIAGRIKDLIIVRGRNHYPQDLERTSAASHPLLANDGAAAFGIEAEGEERLVLVQEVSRAGLRDLDVDRVAELIRNAVADRHELAVHAVVLAKPGAIPRTSSGKVRRLPCREAYLSGSLKTVEGGISKMPKMETGASDACQARLSILTSPVDRMRILAGEVFGCDPAAIDPSRPLVALGLDSLSAMRLVHRAEIELGLSIPLEALLSGASLVSLTDCPASTRGLAGEDESNLRNLGGELPLSHQQQALWFLHRFAPRAAAYHLAFAVRIRGKPKITALRSALGRLASRHPVLRATFPDCDGVPFQRIREDGAFRIPERDGSGWDEDRCRAWLSRKANEPFDLEGGPLLRLYLLHREPDDPLLLWVAHHIILDLQSFDILLGDLADLYAGLENPVSSRTHADHVAEQRSMLDGPEGERLLNWWAARLRGTPPLLNLPVDRARPPVRSFRGAVTRSTVAPNTVGRLRDLAAASRTTLFTVLLASFQVLLRRYSGQEDISVGVPTLGRGPRDGAVAGYFVNPVVVRGDLSGNPIFKELLARTRQTVLEVMAHRDFPFPLLVERLRLERDGGVSPLFQVLFAFQQNPGRPGLAGLALGQGRLKLGTLELEAFPLERGVAQFDIGLYLAESPEGGLLALFEYDTDLFEADTIARFTDHFHAVLAAVASDAGRPISTFTLSEGHVHHALNGPANSEVRIHAGTRNIPRLFEDRVSMHPEQFSVVYDGKTPTAKTELSFSGLDTRAEQIACRLRELGVGPETRVGICMNRSPEMIAALLGALKSGGAYVPLDPSYPEARIRFMLEDARIAVLVGDSLGRAKLPRFQGPRIDLEPDWVGRPANRPFRDPGNDRAAYVLYTSGSTGRPKGVVVTHTNAGVFLGWARSAFSEVECRGVLAATSICFDLSIFEMFLPLITGGTLLLADNLLDLPDAAFRERVSLINTVPSAMEALLRFGPLPPSVKTVVCAGEPLTRALTDHIYATPTVTRVLNLYGPSEATTYATGTVVPSGARAEPTIGTPIDPTCGHVLDSGLRQVPMGVCGTLYLGGAAIARCYWDRPARTAACFVPDPFANLPGTRIYRTGDLARLRSDRSLEWLGRADRQVKIRGFRIEPGEVEVLLRAHPDVSETAVVVREDRAGDPRLVAFVVARASAPHQAEALGEYLAGRLPRFMVPGKFVSLDTLPLTPNGKIDRSDLARMDLTFAGLSPSCADSLPRTRTESLLLPVWSEILGLDRPGIFDHFFEQGGHSLLAVRVMTRVRDLFGLELPVSALFTAPTIASLASLIDRTRARENGRRLPLATGRRKGSTPLSFAQQRLWFLDRLQEQGAIYHMPQALHLHGNPSVLALDRGFQAMAQRHEILRTHIVEDGGTPLQVVAEDYRSRLVVLDLSGMPSRQRASEARRLIDREARYPFRPETQPLWRCRLLRLGGREWVLTVTMHHLISDGWSVRVMVEELVTNYGAWVRGEKPKHFELPLQYADYAQCQRQWLDSGLLANQLDFWKGCLAGLPPLLSIPTDRPRPPYQTHHGALAHFQLSQPLSEDLVGLGHRQGATPFMTLTAAFKILLARYSYQTDIAVGIPVANRDRAELQGLIGLFANTVILRSDLSGNPTFQAVLSGLRERMLAAWNNQDLPFDHLLEALQPQRDLSHSPLFQVMVAWQDLPWRALNLPGLEVRPEPWKSMTARFDLTLFLGLTETGISGSLEYNSDLFEAATAERVLGHYRVLLEGIVANPQAPVFYLPLLTDSERAGLPWLRPTASAASLPKVGSLDRAFERRSLERPQAAAILTKGSPIAEFEPWVNQSLTYRELDRRANIVACHLRRSGIVPEDRVAVCMARSPDLVVTLLGILRAGAAYVPLDPAYPLQWRRFVLEDARARAVLVRNRAMDFPEMEDAGPPLIEIETLPLGSSQATPPTVRVEPGNLAYVIYTSGTTGRPKGVAITHGNLTAFLEWALSAFSEAELDCVLAATSICFDLSVFELFVPLSGGESVFLVDNILDWSESGHPHPITLVNTVPSAMETLMGRRGLPDSVRVVNLAGEALSRGLTDRIFAAAGARKVFNLYGPSEDTTYSTMGPVVPGEARRPTIGRALGQTRACILDPGLGALPIGSPGELFLGGPGLARGYFARPDLTALRFVPDPHGPSNGCRLYRTGDLARFLSDGRLDYLGRMDQQLKIRGFRIEPGEIESALCRYPEVADAVVVAREYGEGPRLSAYVQVGQAPSEAGGLDRILQRRLAERLPSYMVPSTIVVLAALPRTPNGKVDRAALPAPPEAVGGKGDQGPVSPLEARLQGIWCDLLERERVGARQSFFELGGHSLLAMRVLTRIERDTGVRLPLRAIFEAPTISALAERIEHERVTACRLPATVLSPSERTGDPPLSFAQQRMWFLHQLEDGGSVYHLCGGLSISGPFRYGPMVRALNGTAARHESLRTAFTSKNGLPVQVITAEAGPSLALVDLSHNHEFVRERQRLIAKETRRPFDLAKGPLTRLVLIRTAPEEHLLLATMHHIVSDEWSLDILIRELLVQYRSFPEGDSGSLPRLPVQYADFAWWQQRQWRDGAFAPSLEFWKSKLEGAPVLLDLPTDRPRAVVREPRGRNLVFELSPGLSLKLKSLARHAGATPFMALLAGFKVLLSRYSRQHDIVVGAPFSNRDHGDIENLIGFFTNTLALRTDLSGEPGFLGLLNRVRKVTLDAFSHQDMPFDKLVEVLQPERNLGYSPVFQVAFAMRNRISERLSLPGLKLTPIEIGTGTAKFDLTLFMEEGRRGFRGIFEYSDLFETVTIQRMTVGFRTLLAAVVADPDRPVSGLPLSGPAQLRLLEAAWYGPRSAPAVQGDLAALFERRTVERPEATALVVVPDGGRPRFLTFRGLALRAEGLARYLRRRGIGPEKLVGVFTERSAAMIVSVFAILKTGGAYVPLDPTYPEIRLKYMLDDARPELVLCESHLVRHLPESNTEIHCPDLKRSGADHREVPSPNPAVDGDHPAYLIYTSGSTGRPKAVPVRRSSVVNLLEALVREIEVCGSGGTLNVGMNGSFAFDTSVKQLFQLIHGHTLFLFADSLRFRPDAFVSALKRYRIDLLDCTPGQLAPLLEAGLSGRISLLVGGEPIPRSTWRRLAEAPGLDSYNVYGPTECTVDATSHRLRSSSSGPVIGRPLANVAVLILDNRLQPTPLGAPGEIFIGGRGLSRGYLQRPDATAEVFVPNPFHRSEHGSDGLRLYKTGDMGRYLSDGKNLVIAFLGRTDRQLKVRGYRVEPAEIEAALTGFPDVAEAHVSPHGEGLVAHVVPISSRSTTVRGFPRYRLPNNLAITHLNRNETDFLYKEMFEVQAYFKHGIEIGDGDTVIDVGANIGLFSISAHLKAAGVRIYAFEPSPEVFGRLKLNMDLYGVDAALFDCGLAHESTTADFTYYPGFAHLSGLYADPFEEQRIVRSFIRRQQRTQAARQDELPDEVLEELLDDRFRREMHRVRLRTLAEVAAERDIQSIDLLKINVEKSELDVLMGIGDVWPRIRQVAMEVHHIDDRLERVVAMLRERGFHLEVEQDWSLDQETPSNSYVYARREKSSGTSPARAKRQPSLLPEPFLSSFELRGRLARRLPEHMLPQHLVFLESMPRTPNGKVDVGALPGPASTKAEPQPGHVAPRDRWEREIAEIWRAVLEKDRVGVNESFFDLGGNSMLLAQALVKLQETFDRKIPLVELFKHPSVSSLAGYLKRGAPARPNFRDAIDRGGIRLNSRERLALRRRGLRKTETHQLSETGS